MKISNKDLSTIAETSKDVTSTKTNEKTEEKYLNEI